MNQAVRQCTHEIKVLFHRWEEESDLGQEGVLECLNVALTEYYGEDVLEFESEIELDEEDDE
tara:strand:+ start:408 stop:593 length:186 start_codon:yes stop_codon:yes gene_type:complete